MSIKEIINSDQYYIEDTYCQYTETLKTSFASKTSRAKRGKPKVIPAGEAATTPDLSSSPPVRRARPVVHNVRL